MSYFSYVGKLFSNVKGFYNEINAATLTGAIDAIIIEQEDGSYESSPFHVRFGKLGVLRSKEKVVDIEVNGEAVDIQMKLGDSGEAFFVAEYEDEEEDLPAYLATSPLHGAVDLMEKGVKELHHQLAIEENRKRTDDDAIEENGKRTDDETRDTTHDDTRDTIQETVKPDHEGHELSDLTLEKVKQNGVGVRQHLDSLKSSTTTKSGHSRDADVEIKIEDESDETVKMRRKRRRKKKVVNRQRPGASNIDTVDGEGHDNMDEVIFDMDLSSDEELSRLTSTMTAGSMSKSISLPIVEESRHDRTSEWATTHENFYRNSHPFSDTDLSPLGSPSNSRPESPKSDTEVDRQKSIEQDRLILKDEEDDDTLWEWGAMPRKSVTEDTIGGLPGGATQGIDDDKMKSSGGLFHFMKKTKNVRHKPEEEGIYLDDLNLAHMDEETAKLYFPNFPKNRSSTHFKSIEEHDEDTESGRGASLPQSPHSVEGAIGGPQCTFLMSEVKHLGMYSLSLCGGLGDQEGVNLEKFMSKIVTFEDLCERPNMLSNPDLVVRVGDKYYNWTTASPIILAQIAFQKQLPEKTVESLTMQHMPKKKEKKGSYSWFSWRRNNTDATSTTTSMSLVTTSTKDAEAALSKSDGGMVVDTVPSGPSSMTESPKKIKEIDRLTLGGAEHSSSEGDTEGSDKGSTIKKAKKLVKKVCKKSLRLTSEQIKQLKLQPGQNEVTYSVTTQYQGTKRCYSHIYLWKYNDKIIVSDIDGTITKSDVLGQILPVMGRDWSQSGVAQLYSRIAGNGYKFLYLSARAIGQSKITKDLLQNIKQGEMTLPEGPLLLSPTSLISAFHREVIEKKPEEFKISCLKDIGALFPHNASPFYAGFGNKVNDVYAYKAISIPIFRIFTINPHGELKHELSYTFQTSYTKLTDVADHFFPPLHKVPGTRAGEFNQVQYWREPLPQISPLEVDEITHEGSASALTDHATAAS